MTITAATSAPSFNRVRWINADGQEGAQLDGCEVYAIHVDGREAGHMALRRLSPAVVEVTALQGRALRGAVWSHVEGCINAQRLQAVTARPSMARLMEAEGWRITGFILEKEINHGRP